MGAKPRPMTGAPSRRQMIKAGAIGVCGLLPAPSRAQSSATAPNARRQALQSFIDGMPKAELHVHLEGTVEPAVALYIAARNGVEPPYESVDAFEAALSFDSLASFLQAFENTIAVLTTEEDFYDITRSYLEKCAKQNIVHAEIKFDPQAHLRRGIGFDAFMAGIAAAQREGESRFGVHSRLIMCFQRDAALSSAEAAFRAALKHRDHIVAVGLDNTEVTDFPAKFASLFARARAAGFRLTAHCDLDQPNSVEHIRACIEDLQVDRLDHGYSILEDQRLVRIARERQLCLTACPTTDYRTRDPSGDYYFRTVSEAIATMLDLRLNVTVNTDDPGVMGNRYLNEVMLDTASYAGLNEAQLATLAMNSFQGAWLPAEQRQDCVERLKRYVGGEA